MGQLTSTLETPEATEAFGGALARALVASGERRFLVALRGDLGAGKTTFVRGLLRALGHRGPVPSPTYTLVEPYELAGLAIYHLDLYRIGDADELEFLGWRDISDAIALVEWPERAAAALGRADLELHFALRGSARQVEVRAGSAAGAEVGRAAWDGAL